MHLDTADLVTYVSDTAEQTPLDQTTWLMISISLLERYLSRRFQHSETAEMWLALGWLCCIAFMSRRRGIGHSMLRETMSSQCRPLC